MEESIKIIGKRKPCKGGLEATDNLLKLVLEIRGKKPFIPKGFYRFKTFKEKEEWTRKILAR